MLWQKLLLQSTFVSHVRQQTISDEGVFSSFSHHLVCFFFTFFSPPHIFLSFHFLPPCNLGCCDCHFIWMRAKLYQNFFLLCGKVTMITHFLLREGINEKKTFSFWHCPNFLTPPPHDPNSGNLVLFFRKAKFKI